MLTDDEAYAYARILIAIADKQTSNEVVIKHPTMSLTYGDFATLMDEVWLNDKVEIWLKL